MHSDEVAFPNNSGQAVPRNDIFLIGASSSNHLQRFLKPFQLCISPKLFHVHKRILYPGPHIRKRNIATPDTVMVFKKRGGGLFKVRLFGLFAKKNERYKVK